ncbi:MAG: hypothetical protein ACI4I3_04005 [Acutalibacteraceae bacterium]
MNTNTLPYIPAIICEASTEARETYNINGQTVPLVDIPMMSDYKWQLDCLISRIEHREIYETLLHEDVDATINKLKKWLAENQE